MKPNSRVRPEVDRDHSIYSTQTNLIGADEVEMKHSEPPDKPHRNKCIHHEYNGCGCTCQCLPDITTTIHVKLDVPGRHGEDKNAQKGRRGHKHEEEPVIPLPNALSNPWAMVVEALDAVVTNRTVRAAGRPVQHASITILRLHSHTVDNNILGARKA